MAKQKLSSSSFLLFFHFLLFSTATATDALFSKSLSPSSVKVKREKLTHLHFFFHDNLVAKHPTAFRVAEASITNTSSTFFGAIVMMDDPLTLTHDPNSTLVGQAQGLYASASQNSVGLLMALNFAFLEGKYNGSTLSVLGRNMIFSKVREMPIVGGSGLFRFARGYAQARTYTIDLSTGNAVVEYNVYVFHY